MPVRWPLLLALALLVAPLSLAHPVFPGSTAERLVEGHTVFAVLDSPPGASGPPHAVSALPLGTRPPPTFGASNAGVRWLNDQNLAPGGHPIPHAAAVAVLARDLSGDHGAERLPCTGAVLAVRPGAPDPVAGGAFAGGVPGPGVTYVESHVVTDPNDRTWVTDRWSWNTPWGNHDIWTVALREGFQDVPDDGVSQCAPVLDQAFAPATGDHGLAYPAGGDRSHLRYNALLYVEVMGMAAAGSKDHNAGSADRQADVAACHGAACPGGDDEREGNSHAYYAYAPLRASAPDGALGPGLHRTYDFVLFYGQAAIPWVRNVVLSDLAGSTAPT